MKPVVIIGGGVAGIAAAEELRRARVEFLLVDGAPRLGGRWATNDLGADVGCPFFRHSDSTLMALCRRVGMDNEVVTLQGPVMQRRADGTIEPTATSFDAARVTLRRGMASLFTAWQRLLVGELIATPVSAIRWLDDQRCFLLRHAITGQSISHPVTHARVEARAVILATDAHGARLIAENSRCLAPIVPALLAVRTQRCVVGAFLVPRVEGRWYALECDPGGDIDWLAFEERKVPSRASDSQSLLVARASWKLGDQLHHPTAESLHRVYDACRALVPELASQPIDARLHFWDTAWPHDDSFIAVPAVGIPTQPPALALAIAGDYTLGASAELAAQSGTRAARQVLARL